MGRKNENKQTKDSKVEEKPAKSVRRKDLKSKAKEPDNDKEKKLNGTLEPSVRRKPKPVINGQLRLQQ